MRDLLPTLLDLLLEKYTSDDLADLAMHYYKVAEKNGMEEAWNQFTDRFELGNWFYESAILADLNLIDFLDDTKSTRQQQEIEDARERAEIERDLQASVRGLQPM